MFARTRAFLSSIILFLLGLILIFALVYWIRIFLNQQNSDIPIYKVDTNKNEIALTFDISYNERNIDEILEVLDKYDVKATFFVVGNWIDENKDVVKKIYDRGHEIGNHSNTHPHINKLNIDKNCEEITKCSEKLKNITGKEVNLYRCPYGEYNNTVINAADSLNYYPIQWSLDTLDYTGLTENEMWNRLDRKLKKGDIILMHNGTKHTADSLELLIKNIQSKGLEIKKVSDILYKDNYKINENGTQIKK